MKPYPSILDPRSQIRDRQRCQTRTCPRFACMSRSSPLCSIVPDARRRALGACNGFQILCEAGLLPGALLLNEAEKFVCKDVFLLPVNRTSFWTQGVNHALRIPIAHGEGRYVCNEETLQRLKDRNQIA